MSVIFEKFDLEGSGPAGRIEIAWIPGIARRYAAVLSPGSMGGQVPAWALGLLDDGFMLVAFEVDHEPDPDPERRPVWLRFDQAFAHSYVLGAHHAVGDAARVVDQLIARGDVRPDRIGWMGSSSTAMPGLAVATREPRLAAVVAFVATGAFRAWLESWKTHGLWVSDDPDLWPQTDALLDTDDPIDHVSGLFPTAVLCVSGGADTVVDPATTELFIDAARPFYEGDPGRLRHVVYQSFGHNLPIDVVQMYAQHWLRTYCHPFNDQPHPPEPPRRMDESVQRTQINASDHRRVMGAQDQSDD